MNAHIKGTSDNSFWRTSEFFCFRQCLTRAALLLSISLLIFSVGCRRAEPVESESQQQIHVGGISWEIFRGDGALCGVAEGRLGEKLQLAWKFEATGQIKSSPVVSSEGKVYFGSTGGELFCVDVEDGAKVWSRDIGSAVEASVLIAGGCAVVGCEDEKVYCMDALTGEVKWVFKTDDKVLGSANVFANDEGVMQVVFGCYDSFVYCVDLKSGELVWKYQTDSYVNGAQAISDGIVVAGGCDAMLGVINAGSGKAVRQIDAGAYVAASAVIDGGKIFVGNYDDVFMCADVDSGEIVWRFEEAQGPIVSSAAVNGEVVIFGSKDRVLYCLDKSTGEKRWGFRANGGIDSCPVICGDKVVVGCDDGRVYMVDIGSGEKVWEYDTGDGITSSAAIARGKVVIGCDDGSVYAFEEGK